MTAAERPPTSTWRVGSRRQWETPRVTQLNSSASARTAGSSENLNASLRVPQCTGVLLLLASLMMTSPLSHTEKPHTCSVSHPSTTGATRHTPSAPSRATSACTAAAGGGVGTTGVPRVAFAPLLGAGEPAAAEAAVAVAVARSWLPFPAAVSVLLVVVSMLLVAAVALEL